MPKKCHVLFEWPLSTNSINLKTFDQLAKNNKFWQLIKSSNNGILGFKKVLINWKDQVKFDQLTKKKKKSFDQTPNLTENFDKLKMSSEIQSSDHSPLILKWHFSRIIQLKFIFSTRVIIKTKAFTQKRRRNPKPF